MSDERKQFEPFKPTQPQIPGVPKPIAGDSGPGKGAPARPVAKIALGISLAVVILAVIVVLAIRTWSKGEPASKADSGTSEPRAGASAPPAPLPRASLPVGPGEVASVAELAKPWSVKEFIFRKPFTNENVPALVVRLPGGNEQSAGAYWAFVKKTPYGNCELELVTDLNGLAQEFRYRAKHPMVVDRCDGTIYDPLRYGSAAGALVRGEVVAGPGLRPPVAIEVRLKGGMVLAERME